MDRAPDDLRADVAEILETTVPAGPGELWDVVIDEARRHTDDAAPADRRRDLLELLARIRDVETGLARARATRCDRAVQGLAEALSCVRRARTVDDLLDRAPEAGCRAGFDRVLVSRVEDSTWRLHSMHSVREPRWADELVAAGQASPPVLDGGIVESDAAFRAESCIAYDAQHNERVDRNLIRVGRSSSYVVAPLALHGEVFGLLHGDCYYQRRDVAESDRGLLSVLAEGLSQSFGRLMVLDGLRDIHGSMDRLMASPLSAAQPAPPAVAGRRSPVDTSLTTREIEVMDLIAAGRTNRIIARRLRISEGTVKSHVTHILRKLDLTSRAEAIAYWLRRDDG